ncbi:MAG: hypothetical protein QOF33_1948 [Thermomicrobiales bacterium]|jgi:hypothetical protein|nr:hypothetical protein [Thermomicrobiales bacterium]MEA2526503.1 hypothetical protein [Thermomicrobiales bacterium]MEA2528805.1 hypothetical protein [Thermomicrobiales bacterium]MEA2583863.1 hypothetical protein [Thermomicrobiales bacterium]
MDPATDEFHERFVGAVRTAEVMSVFFLRVGQSLILDMRRHGDEGPVILLDEMVATPSDRLLSFRRLRPELPLPERLTLAPWPGAVRSLAESGILDAVLDRCRLEGGEELVDQVQELYRELKTMERTQLRDLVRGVGMQTLWQRGTGD